MRRTFPLLSRVLGVFATGLMATAAAGQANTYTFSTTTTTFASIAGTSLVAAGLDDSASPATNIGFTFTFAGTAYTQFSTSSNGLLGLGATPVSTAYQNALNTGVAPYPNIAPWWDDLYTATGGVTYLLAGTAPNRTLTVQWNVTNCCTGGTADKVFQVRLTETTNTIQFIYGAGALPGSASIGLNTASGNYHSVTATSHTSSILAANDANATWPGSGRVYTFTPPAPGPCTSITALTCGTATSHTFTKAT